MSISNLVYSLLLVPPPPSVRQGTYPNYMITLLTWRQLLKPDLYHQLSLACHSSIHRQSLTTSPLAVHRTHSKSSRRPPLSRSKRVKQQRLSKWWQKIYAVYLTSLERCCSGELKCLKPKVRDLRHRRGAAVAGSKFYYPAHSTRGFVACDFWLVVDMST